MFGLAQLAGSRASQLLELPRSRAGERAAGQRGVPRGDETGRGGGSVGSARPRGRRRGEEGREGPGDGGTPIELPVTSSKSGKNSAWKRAVGAARRPYSCRPVWPPSEPAAPRRDARLSLRTPRAPAPHPAGSRRLSAGARPVGGSAGSAAAVGFRTLDRGGAAVGARRPRASLGHVPPRRVPPRAGPILAPLPLFPTPPGWDQPPHTRRGRRAPGPCCGHGPRFDSGSEPTPTQTHPPVRGNRV